MDPEYGIISTLRDLSTLTEILSAVFATIYFKKYNNSILKYFLAYLWSIVILECSGYILREYFDITNTNLLYNVFTVVLNIYLFFLYWSVLKDEKKKKLVKLYCLLYIISLIIGSFYENYITELQVISYVAAAILLILSIILYFIEILATEKVLHSKKNLLFWISIGFLLFFTGIIPFTITFNYYAKAGGFNVLFAINYLLIVILNLCFIIGFIWSDRKQLY